ncbi:MAG TPA: hypothetical protein VFB72_01370 [Verrucomicrobiae bacterium]|nr:hypothetical protein [Verrucomicrobiae bacterium]
MKTSKNIAVLWRDLFAPGSRTYNVKRRQVRIFVLSVLAGLVVAVVFGLALYELNTAGRL